MRGLGLALILLGASAMRADETPRPVVVTTVQRGPAQAPLELTGSVTARRQTRLSTQLAGWVQKLHVDAGAQVEAGDLVVTLEPELAELALARATAEREQAELNVTEARRLENEVRGLATRGAIPRTDLAARTANRQLQEAALRQTAAQEQQQQALLNRHQLRAPFAGVISRKLTEEGEWLTPTTPTVELIETTAPRLDVQVPQEWLARVQTETTATVTLAAFPDQPLTGRIGAVVPTPDPTARTFLVRVELPEKDSPAQPGMSARVNFTWAVDRPVTQIPRDAVIRLTDGSAKVWLVLEEDGRSLARSRNIEVAPSLRELVEVRRGLQVGERVIIRGNEGLREGTAVEPTSESVTP